MATEKLKIINLLEANSEELRFFGSQVKRCNGKLQVLTHPFYQNQHNIHPEISGYAQMRDKYITACLTHSVPLVIFEEPEKVPLLPSKINTEGTLYVVKTDGATCDLEDIDDPPKLRKLLRNAGVCSVVAGGQYMFLEKCSEYVRQDWITREKPMAQRWVSQKLRPGKCAGGVAYNLLISGFDVALSPVSSPHNFYKGHFYKDW